ncbi:MAG: DUF4136 domain-containing protein [Bacteroidales bacterium]|nr:DUF4136 domain-containing protein [Bacteroidales bacterium]
MKRTTKIVFSLMALVMVLSSCYKETTYYTEDYDLTITHYDVEFDFSTYKTFYITDSVGLISDYIKRGDDDWKAFYSRHGASTSIISSITKHFLDLGYTQLDSMLIAGDSADFAINAVMTLNEQTSYTYYPGYWYGYPGYWYGWGYGYGYYKDAKSNTENAYWGGYYGGYYPWYGSGYSYTYKTGNLMFEMADGQKVRDMIRFMNQGPDYGPNDPDAPEMKYVWSAFVDGYQSGDNNVERVINGIDEAFDNSPYLKQN